MTQCMHGVSLDRTCQACGRWRKQATPYVADVRQVCPECQQGPAGECDYWTGEQAASWGGPTPPSAMRRSS